MGRRCVFCKSYFTSFKEKVTSFCSDDCAKFYQKERRRQNRETGFRKNCLRCDRIFYPTEKNNRICDLCKGSKDWESVQYI